MAKIMCGCIGESCPDWLEVDPRVGRGVVEVFTTDPGGVVLNREGVEDTKAALDAALVKAEGGERE